MPGLSLICVNELDARKASRRLREDELVEIPPRLVQASRRAVPRRRLSCGRGDHKPHESRRYELAIGPETAAASLRVHRSNFRQDRIRRQAVSGGARRTRAKARHPLIHDLGSGSIHDLGGDATRASPSGEPGRRRGSRDVFGRQGFWRVRRRGSYLGSALGSRDSKKSSRRALA